MACHHRKTEASYKVKPIVLAAETTEQKNPQPPLLKNKIRITKPSIEKQGSGRMKTARIVFLAILSVSI